MSYGNTCQRTAGARSPDSMRHGAAGRPAHVTPTPGRALCHVSSAPSAAVSSGGPGSSVFTRLRISSTSSSFRRSSDSSMICGTGRHGGLAERRAQGCRGTNQAQVAEAHTDGNQHPIQRNEKQKDIQPRIRSKWELRRSQTKSSDVANCCKPGQRQLSQHMNLFCHK